MSSKRHFRRRSCEGKIKYDDKKKALNTLYALKKQGQTGLHVYHCKFCNCWHIGHWMSQKKVRHGKR